MLEPWFDVSGRPAYIQNVAEHFRDIYHGVLVANNGFDFDSATQLVKNGTADMVSFGKAFISNPDLVERFRKNAPLSPWKEEYFYKGGGQGYTDYPCLAGQ